MGNLFSISISVDETFPRCWDCIVGEANYTRKLEQNLKALSVELEQLEARRSDMKQAVDLAEQQRMKRLSQVQLWLSRVRTVVAEADELIEAGPQEIQKLCFDGRFSKNCKSSYKFGKKVAQKLEEIVDLKNEGVFDKVAEKEPAAPVDVRLTEPTVGLESTLERVWCFLEGNNVGIIGLHGLGGVGKTTLLTQINNKLSNSLLGYDTVIWVVVSKDHNIERVQERICVKFGLSSEFWMHKSSDDKAIIISRVLSKKKFVLLMDDVWERVDLIKVGIPIPNQENGCKLIFTTRFLEVCGQMGARKNIQVECLGEDDAWKLFEEKVGEETLDNHPDIRKLAKQVAAKCGGLPLALCTIGRTMACKKMPQDWKYAIEVLKEFPHKLGRMDQEVYSLLKFSYDSLPNDTMRSCFLYCSLYPEDFVIDKNSLIEYWFCEGFLKEFNNISKARLQGNNIITCLLNACLLETCEGTEDLVKMHDVIRDMALWIAGECEAPEKKYCIRAGQGSMEVVLGVENWEGARMSLEHDGIEELIGRPICPNLQTLFLSYNKLKVISSGFFQFMPNLRVLNLGSNLKLTELPEEISQLVSLESLDLNWTGIREVPMNLNRLSKLKCLKLGVAPNLKKVPRQLICNISKLQIFIMYLSSKDVGELDKDNVLSGGNEDLIEELECLQHLDLLSIEIKNAFALERILSSLKLVRCIEKLALTGFGESKILNVLSLVNIERLEALGITGCKSIEEIIAKTERDLGEGRMIQSPTSCNTPCFDKLNTVIICGCDKLRDLTWLILPPNLRLLNVMRCSKLEEIVSKGKLGEVIAAVGSSSPKPFPKLERLILGDLPELKSIYWDALRFPCLRQLKVFNCSKLKKLPLNLDSAKGNKISIEGYQEWWDEVEWEDEATQNAFLRSFRCAYWWKDMRWEAEKCLNRALYV